MSRGNKGIIFVSKKFLLEEYKLLYKCFQDIDFILIDMEEDYDTNSFKFKGISPQFTKTDEGCSFPTYQIEVSSKDDVVYAKVISS